jgi:hypothetical protein
MKELQFEEERSEHRGVSFQLLKCEQSHMGLFFRLGACLSVSRGWRGVRKARRCRIDLTPSASKAFCTDSTLVSAVLQGERCDN